MKKTINWLQVHLAPVSSAITSIQAQLWMHWWQLQLQGKVKKSLLIEFQEVIWDNNIEFQRNSSSTGT